MKGFLFIALLLASFAVLGEELQSIQFANNQSSEQSLTCSQVSQSSESRQSQCSSNIEYLADLAIDKQLEKRGCCSWHGGVCGCSAGRAVCCDGKLSPTCGC